jgi:hypothetical protein
LRIAVLSIASQRHEACRDQPTDYAAESAAVSPESEVLALDEYCKGAPQYTGRTL